MRYEREYVSDRRRAGYRSYDYILERRLGRVSKTSGNHFAAANYKGILLGITVLVCILVSLLLFTNLDHVEASNGQIREKQYKNVEIQDGDTVWTLAEEFKTYEYKSTMELVREILEINNINEKTVLKPGNRILIPNYVDVSR